MNAVKLVTDKFQIYFKPWFPILDVVLSFAP